MRTTRPDDRRRHRARRTRLPDRDRVHGRADVTPGRSTTPSSSAAGSTRSRRGACSRAPAGACASWSGTTTSAARSARPRSPSPDTCTTSSAPGIRSGSAAPPTLSSATTSRARGLEYLNTELPTATLFPDGESAFLLRTADANAAELDRHAPGDGDAWRRTLDEFFPNADLAFGVLGTELWSSAGASPRHAGLPAAGPPRAARVHRHAADECARLADRHVRLRARARPARPVGPAHGARPGRRRLRLHGAGDRGRRAGRRHADPARRRSEARRRACAADPRPRRRARDRTRRRASPRLGRRARPACARPTARRSLRPAP